MAFRFLDPGPLVDGELRLIVPESRWTDEVLRSCAHPAGRGDPTYHTTRAQIEDYLVAARGGHYLRESEAGVVPQYHFWMHLDPTSLPPIIMAGSISLRVGESDDLRKYLGHVGYNVFPAARGHHYAERSCRLLFPLAKKHGLNELWITCNPENTASRRTCERLGGRFVEIVSLPVGHILYQRGERHKCRYQISLNEIA